MMPAVSIIIPVYNTEKYLRECLDSVLAQTMTDIEVLCVDDGSTDSSPEILNEYAAKDPRVTVINSETNKGLGGARNLGLPHATGKYLLFLDSDDIFKPQIVEKTYARAEETNADICVFGGEEYYENTGERRPMPWLCRSDLCPETVFSAKDRPNDIFCISSPSACNKLFRREFINAEGIVFPNMRTCEDGPFSYTALACAERITLLNEVLFSYRQHSASLIHNQDKYPLVFYDFLIELRSRLTVRGLYEPLKNAFAAFAALNCLYNLSIRKTVPGFITTYNCVRDHAIPEFELDTLPETNTSRPRILDVQKLDPAEYAARYRTGLWRQGFSPETENERFLFDALEENNRIIAENKKKHDEEIQTIMNSPSVKIGRAVTAPMRKIRDLLRKS